MAKADTSLGPKGDAKVAKTMGEFGAGKLRSGSDTGPKVTNPKQAKAIALNQGAKASAGGNRPGDGSNRPRIK
jgi:hypothetical protein